jgi:hypothetical protein
MQDISVPISRAVPTALYGIVLLMPAIAYHLLQQAIIRTQVTQVAPKGGTGL